MIARRVRPLPARRSSQPPPEAWPEVASPGRAGGPGAADESVEVLSAPPAPNGELRTSAGTGTGRFNVLSEPQTAGGEAAGVQVPVEPEPEPPHAAPLAPPLEPPIELPLEPSAEPSAGQPLGGGRSAARHAAASGGGGGGGERGLGTRLVALRELVGLSRTRLEQDTLAEAVRVLEEASARGRLSRAHTTVAIAGPTGCGKSSLFNAIAGVQLSDTGVRRPTTSIPVACVWEASERDGGAEGLLERLGVPPRARRRAHGRTSDNRILGGLVLLDLPDQDSMDPGHRAQVDRLLKLVDAVVWVVDPEKYADALLHERYLRPLAGHAEVTYVVLNQTDRLSSQATEELLDDLRRLLDEDGVALGEYGEPGAQVLALSALTGEGVPEFRECLEELVAHRQAAARRLAADVDQVVVALRPAFVVDGERQPEGLTVAAREEFEERLGVAVGAAAAGRTAERVWLRQADAACGTAWAGLARWQARRLSARRGELPEGPAGAAGAPAVPVPPQPAGRPVVEQAVRGLVDEVTSGLPGDWARSVRDAARAGGEVLPAALDKAVATVKPPERVRPRWWTMAAAGQAALMVFQLVGLCWLLFGLVVGGMGADRWPAVALMVVGAVGGPLLAWCCRLAARAPAEAFGAEHERQLRRLAADHGRSLVLEPVAAELLRYSEVRDQYVLAASRQP
ncbi:ATP-binding protein [Streptomyces sp. OF1]|uniref:ATP-binding protein n=1 Tax=Streptomyces alkaliterrae TaxID=2213162 RepID=A0A5P0YQH6_9ACTN|nr:ATP-binding protein [Streptomyces alkaliterrae]